jgi:hypothetical protein
MAFGFGNNANTDNISANGQQQSLTGNKAAGKKWRARIACTYNGTYVAAGTVVSAAEMKNPHFEPLEENVQE